MAFWGFLDLKITGPDTEMQRLTARVTDRADDWPLLPFEDAERGITHWPAVEPNTPRREDDTLILNLWTKYGIDWRLFDLLANQFPALMIEGKVYFEGDAYEEILTRYVQVRCHGGKWSGTKLIDDGGGP